MFYIAMFNCGCVGVSFCAGSSPEHAAEVQSGALRNLAGFHALELKSNMLPSLVEQKFAIALQGTRRSCFVPVTRRGLFFSHSHTPQIK